jgi:lipopolysaccharide/colanic/teichoic acid biosynthesis glycosyltransferase
MSPLEFKQKQALPKYSFIKGGDNSAESASLTLKGFYIGQNADELNEYPHLFQSKCSIAGDLNEAIAFVRSVNQKQADDIQVIIIDTPLDTFRLEDFNDALSGTPLMSVPVIYIANGLSSEQKNTVIALRLVDDIIYLSKDLVTLRERLDFITRVKSELCKRKKTISLENKFSAFNGIGCVVKRLTDIILSSALIIALSPLFLTIAALIKLTSSGPIFFNAYRAGRGYRIFKFYKFRTMKVGAERIVHSLSHLNCYSKNDQRVFFKMKNDPRVTRFGAFLRNASLDELPQLFNVLKGDMSLVGNRPLPLYEAAGLTTDEFADRFLAPAGLTGLWQIRKNTKKELTAEERINLDINYARHHTLMMDFWIMAQTPKVIFKAHNS